MSDKNMENIKNTEPNNDIEKENDCIELTDDEIAEASGGQCINFKKIAQTTMKVLTK